MPHELSYGSEPADSPPLPPPEGPLTEAVTRAIVRPASDHRDRASLERVTENAAEGVEAPLDNLDLQLALNLCYELHYLSFRGVDPAWEWDPELLALRSRMESIFLGGLDRKTAELPDPGPGDLPGTLVGMKAPDAIGELAGFVERESDLPQMRELLIHRSAERLRRCDAWLWTLPRLQGRTRTALALIEGDENARLGQLGRSLRSVGLDDRVGAYRDLLPPGTLCLINLYSLFCLKRQGRGAASGHVAMAKILSGREDRACGRAMRRLGFGDETTGYCEDSAVSSEAMVEVAVVDLAGRLATEEPMLAGSILFGARAALVAQGRFSEWMLDRWKSGSSSLLTESVGFDRSSDS